MTSTLSRNQHDIDETQDSLMEMSKGGQYSITDTTMMGKYTKSPLKHKSVMNRKELFRKFRDHLKAQERDEKVVNHKMDKYLKSTAHHSKNIRFSGLEDASREIERQNTQLNRLKFEMNTIAAFRTEMKDKQEFVNHMMLQHPEALRNKVDPKVDIHNYSYDELKLKYTMCLENAKWSVAATKIQRKWRSIREKII